MKVLLHSDEALTLSALDAPGLDISVDYGAHAHFSAFQMFAVSIGLCTASVLMGYGEQIDADTSGLAVRMSWRMADDPPRIRKLEMEVSWPGVPESRLRAAERVAAHCPLHRTLEHPPKVATRVTRQVFGRDVAHRHGHEHGPHSHTH